MLILFACCQFCASLLAIALSSHALHATGEKVEPNDDVEKEVVVVPQLNSLVFLVLCIHVKILSIE